MFSAPYRLMPLLLLVPASLAVRRYAFVRTAASRTVKNASWFKHSSRKRL